MPHVPGTVSCPVRREGHGTMGVAGEMVPLLSTVMPWSSLLGSCLGLFFIPYSFPHPTKQPPGARFTKTVKTHCLFARK